MFEDCFRLNNMKFLISFVVGLFNSLVYIAYIGQK